MAGSDPSVTDWLQIVRAEYLEMPGLCLTAAEVQRLWGIDSTTCKGVLDALLRTGFLRRTRSAGYVRADAG